MNKVTILAICLAATLLAGQSSFKSVKICDSYKLENEAFENPWGEPFPVKATAYCSCCDCCGHNHGITKSGKRARQGITVASNLYYGKTVIMYDENMDFMGFYECMDTGNEELDGIDIFMDDHEKALEFGEKLFYIQVVDAVG